MSDMNDDSRVRPPFFPLFIATGFGAGYSPVAPGTAGALAAVLLWAVAALFVPFAVLQAALAAVVVLFTALGVWSGTVMERYWGEDPSKVVVDEMVGVWIPLLAVPENYRLFYALAAFVLFRFFDIVKPLGVRCMERFKGGWGIMADDILAGVYSAILLVAARFILH